jgi:hypothetical protein
MFSKGCLKKKKKKDMKDYATETICVPQRLKYLLSGPSEKIIADP